MGTSQKDNGKSIREVVLYAHEKVSKMPSWKTKGFDQRASIVLKSLPVVTPKNK